MAITTIYTDLVEECFNPSEALIDDHNVQDLTAMTIDGITPTAAQILCANGPGGGNPHVKVTFASESQARHWFGIVADDTSPGWFEENTQSTCCPRHGA